MKTDTARSDAEMRDLFAPLKEYDLPPGVVDELRRGAASPRPVRRVPRRAIAVATCTASIALGLALLPGSSRQEDGGDPGGALQAAAAVAADRPIPDAALAPWRYVKRRETSDSVARDGSRVVAQHETRIEESWVGPRWKGRTHLAPTEFSYSGDASLIRELKRWMSQRGDYFTKRQDRPYAYGDGAIALLDPAKLPADREGIAEVLRDGIRHDRWGPYEESRGRETMPPGNQLDSYVAYSFIGLLVNARLTPDQRAALLDVLAEDRGARDLGRMKDSEGRPGRAVALDYEDPDNGPPALGFRVIFDPRTAEILEWWYAEPKALAKSTPPGPSRIVTVLETGYTDRIGERP